MTTEDVLTRVEAIRASTTGYGDPEAAHIEEDDLYKDVLRAIANGAENADGLAAQALAVADMDFPRWYA